LDEFVYCSAQIEETISLAQQLQKESSGTCYPITNYIVCVNFSIYHHKFLAAIAKVVEPRFYSEAVKEPYWRKAMAEEIKALDDNETWG